MLRIQIAGATELDLFQDTFAPITKRILDIEDYASRVDGFSEAFDIPLSQRNNLVFEQIFNFDVVTGTFDPKRRVYATLLDDSNILFTGALKLNSVSLSTTEKFYTVEFLGSITNLVLSLDNLNLRQLNLAEWDHTKTIDVVEASWANVAGYVYPQIVYTDTLDPVKQFKEFYLNKMFPATYIHTILDKVFDAAGYTYSSKFFNSEYFRTIVTPFTRQAINQADIVNANDIGAQVAETNVAVGMSLPSARHSSPSKLNDTWKYFEGNFNVNTVGQSYPIFNQTTGSTLQWEWADPGNAMGSSSDIYTCPADGTYDVDILVNFGLWIARTETQDKWRLNDGTFEYRWWVYLQAADGSQLKLLAQNAVATPDNPYHISSIRPESVNTYKTQPTFNDTVAAAPIRYAGTLDLKAGDVIYVKYGYKNKLSFKSGFISDGKLDDIMVVGPLWLRTVGNEVSRFKIAQSVDESTDWSTKFNLSLARTLPDMSASEWLVDIIKAFTLMIEPDPDDPTHLRIEPYNDFYAIGKLIDWTDKLDYENNQEMEFTADVKQYSLSWAADNDWLATRFNEDTGGLTFGEYQFLTGDEWSTSTQTLNLKHASTLNLADTARAGSRVIPYLVNENDGKFTSRENKPRLLFYKGLKPSDTWTIIESNALLSTNKTFNSYPYVGMWDDPIEPKNTLEFYWSPMYYNISKPYKNLPTYNLFNKFHQFPIRKTIDSGYRKLTASFHLTSLDIHDFKFQDKIRINNTTWRVLEIQQWVSNDTLTQVVLENDIEYDFESPINGLGTCPLNIKTTVTPSGTIVSSDAPISPGCCYSLGGKIINGACVIPPKHPLLQITDERTTTPAGSFTIEKYNPRFKDPDPIDEETIKINEAAKSTTTIIPVTEITSSGDVRTKTNGSVDTNTTVSWQATQRVNINDSAEVGPSSGFITKNECINESVIIDGNEIE